MREREKERERETVRERERERERERGKNFTCHFALRTLRLALRTKNLPMPHQTLLKLAYAGVPPPPPPWDIQCERRFCGRPPNLVGDPPHGHATG